MRARAGVGGALVVGFAVLVLALVGCSTGAHRPAGTASDSGPDSAAVPTASISVQPAALAPVSPLTPIVVRADGGRLRSVSVTNAAAKTLAGSFSADHRTWTSVEDLGYRATYTVAASAADAEGRSVSRTVMVHTVAPRALAFPSFIPLPSQTDVGVGQPIVVRFDRSVTDKPAAQAALHVTSDPPQNGAWHWFSNTEVHYRPEVYWQPGTTVRLDAQLYGVDLGRGVYGKADRSDTFHVHDAWVAKADGASEQMQIFHNGALVTTMPISLGSARHPTHTGPHVVSDKRPSIVMDSATYGVGPGQRGHYREVVELDERISSDGEFVHSAPWSVGQQGDSNVSHGCVNLSPTNAQWFYDHFGIGDVVEVTNSGGPQLPIWDGYGDWAVSWAEWTAGAP